MILYFFSKSTEMELDYFNKQVQVRDAVANKVDSELDDLITSISPKLKGSKKKKFFFANSPKNDNLENQKSQTNKKITDNNNSSDELLRKLEVDKGLFRRKPPPAKRAHNNGSSVRRLEPLNSVGSSGNLSNGGENSDEESNNKPAKYKRKDGKSFFSFSFSGKSNERQTYPDILSQDSSRSLSEVIKDERKVKQLNKMMDRAEEGIPDMRKSPSSPSVHSIIESSAALIQHGGDGNDDLDNDGDADRQSPGSVRGKEKPIDEEAKELSQSSLVSGSLTGGQQTIKSLQSQELKIFRLRISFFFFFKLI